LSGWNTSLNCGTVVLDLTINLELKQEQIEKKI
jgi:hypothetical protein